VQGYDQEFKGQWENLQKRAMPNYTPYAAPQPPVATDGRVAGRYDTGMPAQGLPNRQVRSRPFQQQG
jgi:hypothetical protein